MSQEQFKKFLETKRAAEQASGPNKNIPPVAPRQYQRDANANITVQDVTNEIEDTSEKEEREAISQLASLSGLYNFRNAKMVRRVDAVTTTSVGTTN